MNKQRVIPPIDKKILQTELRVAGTWQAQPVWWRILKYTLLVAGSISLYRTRYFWVFLLVFSLVGLCLHLVYRYKTKNWTESWGWWKKEFRHWD